MLNPTDLYRHVWQIPTYCHGTIRATQALPRLIDARPTKVLDVGCGRNEVVHHLIEHGIDALGLDLALPVPRPAHAIEGSLLNLADWLCEVEIITAFDVLEHLHPDELDEHLDTMAQLAHRSVFAIANMPDPHDVPDLGRVDLHLIQQDAHWWCQRIGRITHWDIEVQRLEYPERFFLWCGDWS